MSKAACNSRSNDTERKPDMSATLKLTHKAIGAEVRRGTFDVVLDRERVGSVEMNDTIEIPIEAGRHTLQVRNGRNLSRTLTFDAGRGPGRRLPVHRKEVLADLSPVVRRATPGALAPSGIAGALTIEGTLGA